jgi:hypothetical protein
MVFKCVFKFFFSCSPEILLFISTVDPCIPYFKSDIIFALLVINCVLPNVMKFFWQLFLLMSYLFTNMYIFQCRN